MIRFGFGFGFGLRSDGFDGFDCFWIGLGPEAFGVLFRGDVKNSFSVTTDKPQRMTNVGD